MAQNRVLGCLRPYFRVNSAVYLDQLCEFARHP